MHRAESSTQPDVLPLDVQANSVLAGVSGVFVSLAPWLIIPVLLIAAGVRLWGIEAGLPLIYHPDEPNYIRIAQGIFKTGDINPHLFNYPSLFFYLNTLAYVPFYLGGKLFGAFHSRADLVGPGTPIGGVSLMLTTLPSSVLLGRLLTVLFSVGCVTLVYVIGTQVSKNRAVGLLSALFIAVSTPAVVNGRTITPDTFVVFFILFAFWGALQVFMHGKTWHYVVAGIGIGLAGGAKYNGALIAVTLVTAHFLRTGPKGFKDIRLYMASLLSVATFFLTTPYALLDYTTFTTDLQYEAQHYYNGHLGMEGSSLDYYLTYLRTVEGPVILLALLEGIRGLLTRQKTTILLSVFPLLYFLFIIQYTVRNDRTLLPLLPFAYMLGALFLVRLAGAQLLWVRKVWRPAARWALLSGLAIVTVIALALPATTMAQATASRLGGIESRQNAMAWIEANVPAGSRIAIESYTPYIDPNRYTLSGASSMADHPPEWYVQNADYLVFCKFMFRRYYDERDKYPTEVSRYDYMFSNFTRLAVFPHEDYEISIYKVPGP